MAIIQGSGTMITKLRSSSYYESKKWRCSGYDLSYWNAITKM
jgi:hypothetical protein